MAVEQRARLPKQVEQLIACHQCVLGFELSVLTLSVSSKSLRILLYSSAQLVSSSKPWFSTGNGATDQFCLRSSMSRCTRRTLSWNSTFVSTMPWQISRAFFNPSAKYIGEL